ncbi:hypothetical protein Misp04_39230 [Micromonospora sp. NBRC 101691]|nr:hypothetical protein Misp04_39230 [Micromonospora sp. NBRC 101691]
MFFGAALLVAEEFSVVPRHLFAPGEPSEMVYDSDTELVAKSRRGQVHGPDGDARAGRRLVTARVDGDDDVLVGGARTDG